MGISHLKVRVLTRIIRAMTGKFRVLTPSGDPLWNKPSEGSCFDPDTRTASATWCRLQPCRCVVGPRQPRYRPGQR